MILDLIALDQNSKAWVYQSKTKLSDIQIEGIREDLYAFLNQWTSHNQNLFTYGNVFHGLFLAIFVDERYAGASGCSIDKSVHFIEELGKKYDVDFFDRMHASYMVKAEDEDGEDISEIFTIPLAEMKTAYTNGIINDETFVFNNLVKTKSEFLNQWVIPLNQSWHKKFV